MSANEKIFHESWYQIANQRIYLRPSVRLKRQLFRGAKWYVLHEPFTNHFFRLRPAVYEFIARLDMNKTVEETWYWILENKPQEAPSQGEIIELLAQLYHANLLYSDIAPNSVKLFQRYKKKKHAEIKMTLFNILFARIPLFDPDNLLKYLNPLIKLIISPFGIVIWCAVTGIGIKTAIDNFAGLQVQSDGILAASNLFMLYIGIVIIKIIHELGHAFAVRRFGGEVHAMGIMLLVLTPLPYTDATASWAFRSKWKRIFVGAAGMIFELFVAAIAVIVWAKTGEGVLHSLAYNMVFTASVTTLLFNLNPLLRYDGYYMLSDLTGMPNLQQQSQRQLTYLLERWAFGKKDCTSPSTSITESWLLSLYAVTSSIYRVVIFSGILLFISNKMLLLAVIMAIFFTFSWAILPLVKFIKYLTTSPGLARVRGRALRVSAAAALIVLALLNYIPFPYNFKAPGVLKAVDYIVAANPTAGRVERLGLPSGARVKKGDTLFILDNFELKSDIAETRAALTEAKMEYVKALDKSQSDLEPLEKQIEAHTLRLEHLERQYADLAVRAEIGGVWVSPDADDFTGRWLPRGTQLGELIDPKIFYFVSVVPQREISELFYRKVRQAGVRLSGQAYAQLPVSKFTTIPMEQNRLPSSALGFQGGGDIAVVPGDSSGVKTAEPFYEVRAVIGAQSGALLLHGRSGKIKFALGYKPLLWQGWRKLRQLVQKHYQI
jgi:putative peptide zinc metalloprotease protein